MAAEGIAAASEATNGAEKVRHRCSGQGVDIIASSPRDSISYGLAAVQYSIMKHERTHPTNHCTNVLQYIPVYYWLLYDTCSSW